MSFTKISLNVDDELLARVDEYAKQRYINRSAAFCVLVANSLRSDSIADKFNDAIQNIQPSISFNVDKNSLNFGD